jgi:3-oxoacyl-[acyl-carrier-protein] synthase-3
VATPNGGTVLSKGSYKPLAMNGKEVYKFATREVPKVIEEALEAADMKVDQVDWLLLHQVRYLVVYFCWII